MKNIRIFNLNFYCNDFQINPSSSDSPRRATPSGRSLTPHSHSRQRLFEEETRWTQEGRQGSVLGEPNTNGLSFIKWIILQRSEQLYSEASKLGRKLNRQERLPVASFGARIDYILNTLEKACRNSLWASSTIRLCLKFKQISSTFIVEEESFIKI